jgi:hypothetical protein
MSDGDKVRVLVRTVQRQDGVATVELYDWEECSAAQAAAYANGDPAWREAKAETSWTARLWHRLTG